MRISRNEESSVRTEKGFFKRAEKTAFSTENH